MRQHSATGLILIIPFFTAALLAGSSLTPMQAYAASQDLESQSMGGSIKPEESPARDLTLEQASVAGAGPFRPGDLKITVSADRPDMTYATGEIAHLTIDTNQSAYVTILNVGPSGQVTQLFPNRYQPNNFVQAGKSVEIGGSPNARIVVSGPVGSELLKVVGSEKPLTVISDAQLKSSGIFPIVDGGVSTLSRNLEVVASQSDGGDTRKITMTNLLLHTVGKRTVASGQTAVVATTMTQPQPAQAEPSLETLTASGVYAFPLLVAVDKPSYIVGEDVTLAVTPVRTCHLTVLEIPTEGFPRVLFPNKAAADDNVAAMKTIFVAGGDSPVSYKAAGAAGTEHITALCTTEPALRFSVEATAEAFASAGDRTTVARNLSLAADRPAGTISTASISFVIKP